MRQESERWNVRCAQKMTRRGGAGKGSGSKGRGGAEYGQACTKEHTGAVAVRAALKSAMQVGRGDEGNMQAEIGNPTKCRDSLQPCMYFAASQPLLGPSSGPLWTHKQADAAVHRHSR
jgi:hypothetical protein